MLADQMASFALGFDGADDVDAAAIAAIMDGLGCMVGGSAEELGRVVRKYGADFAAPDGKSSILVSPIRCPPSVAAYVNATAGHSLCYDDSSASMMGHPTVAVFPAALAIGEYVGASGCEVLNAFNVGSEIAIRLSEVIAPTHYQRGWHATSVCGVVGAAAAAARLLDLDQVATRHALGIAATTAAGLRANFGTMTMIYHAGLAARGGVDAALLARNGMTSARDPFVGKKGYFSVLAGSEVGAAVDVDGLVARLGAPFSIVEPGLDVKPFPCGALSHRSIQGALELRAEAGFRGEDVEWVECAIPTLNAEVLVNTMPESVLAARISLTYPVAVALQHGSCGLDDFSAELLADERLMSLVGRIRQRPAEVDTQNSAEVWGAAAEVTIGLRGGEVLTRRVERLKGTPVAPLSDSELRAKFTACCDVVFEEGRSDRIRDAITGLADIADIRDLAALVS